MFPPDYFRQTSFLNGKVKIMGNTELAELIENTALECIRNNVELYAAQEQIKIVLINKYGTEWYERSGEAVNYIIENKYCDAERAKNPVLDKKQYDFDITNNVLY
jgi:hypothetical protein